MITVILTRKLNNAVIILNIDSSTVLTPILAHYAPTILQFDTAEDYRSRNVRRETCYLLASSEFSQGDWFEGCSEKSREFPRSLYNPSRGE
jgi:hypothetical protein